jgi:hypothetical protein
MRRLTAVFIVLVSGFGLSACGSTTHTQSYKDGWNMRAFTNTVQLLYVLNDCSKIYEYYAYARDLRSDFIAGCQDAGKTNDTYNERH